MKPMKAIVNTSYGTPDVLRLEEVAAPTPKDDEVQVRVRAAVVGPADCAFRKGEPFVVRLLYGLKRPKYAIGGTEFAGEVSAVGSAVTSFKPGDAVYGMSPDHFGAHAEYVCVRESKPLAPRPAGTSYEEAVGIMDGAPTALTFLRSVARLEPGQRVLVNGASGAVGSAAVQLARHFGAHVTGVCSTANVEMVKALGADEVIDYTREDFTRSGQTYDVIFDAVGKSSFSRCKRALTPQGVYMTTNVPSLPLALQILWTSVVGGKKAKFTTAGLKQSQESLRFLKELAESGKLKATIDRCYPLEQAADAHRYVDTGRKKGSVVLVVAGQPAV